MLGAGLLPVIVWALASWQLADRVLAVSMTPLEDVLDRVDEQLSRHGDAPELVQDLTQSRLQLAQAELGRRSLRRLAPWGFLTVIATSGALLLVAALLLGRASSRKLERLAESADWYGRGELSHRVPEPAVVEDEIDALLLQFNRMGAQLEQQRRRLETSEALAAWQEVARTMAHDLKNPLTAIRLSVARLARSGELVDALTGELEVLMRMTESFSEFAKLPAPVVRPLELRALLEEVCALYGEGGPVAVELAPGASVATRGDADQLRRALGNLVKNAIEATPPGGRSVHVQLGTEGGELIVAITDHGPGVREALDGRRLVTTLGTSKPGGSGLGLPIAAKIIHDHAGALRLEPAPDGGARAIVRLPLVGEARS